MSRRHSRHRPAPVRGAAGAADADALARMYRERVAARAAGRRAFQVAAAFGAVDLEPTAAFTDDVARHLVDGAGWDPRAIAQLREALGTDVLPAAAYSAARDSVWTPDLTAAEFPEIGEAPPGALVAYEWARDGRLQVRTVFPEP